MHTRIRRDRPKAAGASSATLATKASGLALLCLLPGSAPAVILMETPSVFATTRHETGSSANNTLPPRAVDVTGTDVADATMTVPAFTPPRGAPDDTTFLPARLDAYQDTRGFNTTRVSGAFASGRAYNRLTARTEWDVNFTVFTSFLTTVDVDIQYMLFPGAVGLTTFGDFAGEAGLRYLIRGVVAGEVVLRRTPGQPAANLITTGTFAGRHGVTRGNETRDGLTYDVVRTEPYFGDQRLGTYYDLERASVEYVMEAWVEVPGDEIGAFAMLGDPFDVRSDPKGAAARWLPGPDRPGLAVIEAAAVPEPSTWAMLLTGALYVVCAARPKRAASATP
ncbi:MAG: PEP-CTERM sorting domain-containing protein [Burkholderiales bacterium]